MKTENQSCYEAGFYLNHRSAGMSWSSDFRKSAAAYENGDFATALREWTPQALYFLRKNELVEMVAKDKPTSSRNGASQWRVDRNIFGKN